MFYSKRFSCFSLGRGFDMSLEMAMHYGKGVSGLKLGLADIFEL